MNVVNWLMLQRCATAVYRPGAGDKEAEIHSPRVRRRGTRATRGHRTE